MARYGRETEKHVFSFMDGVPVKISEQFKPPRKVGLPAGYQQRLSAETVSEEYDFSLEHSVLQKMREWRKLRKVAAENRKARIKAQDAMKLPNQQAVKVTKGSDLESSSSNNPSNSVSPIPNNGVSYTNLHPKNSNFSTDNSSILTPIQIAQPALEPESSIISHFNFSDFEADTSSPFDNMELKTINEMEVLAHVLQPLSHSPDTIKRECFSSNTVHCNAVDTMKSNVVDKDVPVPKNGLIDYSGPIYNPSHQMTDGSCTFSEKQGLYNIYCSENVGQRAYDFYPNQVWTIGDANAGTVGTDPQSSLENLKISNTTCGSYSTNTFAHSQSIPVQHITHTPINPVPQDDSYSSKLRNSKPVPVDNFPDYYCQTFPSPNQGADRSHSKSVPDIVQELEKELMCKELDRRSGHSPRPNSFGSVGLENWKPWPDLDSPEHLRSCLKKPASTEIASARSSERDSESTLPNPFDDLSPVAQQLALHISEMGFELPRVARACQAVGTDDKKVVEYLLQIQSLEDENYPGDRAERALVINAYDRSKAIVHLNAMEQLLGLGFKEQEIFDALVRFENNRDKALDHLIS